VKLKRLQQQDSASSTAAAAAAVALVAIVVADAVSCVSDLVQYPSSEWSCGTHRLHTPDLSFLHHTS